ncbi:hypothetical protein DUNSADRAFT_12921 [Dunaliella salina]|uniref:Encoded protein n=1 Tax=Dunaliella salina TaxID=3046 RepID=A0ABQ7GAN4_DUNSA|nr:hypothetical protein DUNSADRAFT_12921 [Dunaliella salina]|eukprot:KAF5831608.1 hypothetical protein DUNSADRAFT_12921 [Dunaliella salina]
MRRLPAFSLQCLKLKPLNQKSKGKKKPGQAGPEMDRSFDASLAAFFESGASQRGKPPWSGIKFLRLEGFELSMHSTPFIGLAAPQLSHVHLSHTKMDGMCVSGLLSCPSLSHLTFSHVAWLTPKMSERALMVIPLLQHLKHLTFIEVPLPLVNAHTPFPFLHIPRLESLHIIGCPMPETMGWLDLLASIGHSCTNLTSLVIHPRLRLSSASPLLTQWVHDLPIAALASGCPYLRYLDFGPFATVSDTGVGEMISRMPKLQCVVAQDLRPPPHRSRQEAAAIAGEWVVAVEERRKRQQHRSKRKREGRTSGQGHAGAGDQAPPTVGQCSHAGANPATTTAAAAAAESSWEAQVEAAEAAIQAHLYPVHGWPSQDTALPSAEPPATLPWAQLTLFAPSVESIAALPLGPHTKIFLGGLLVRPGTQPALAAQAASQLARCGSFYSAASTSQETAEAINSGKHSGMDISIGSKMGKLMLIFLPSWSTSIEAPPNTMPDADDMYTPAMAAEAGVAPLEAAMGLMNWIDTSELMGKPTGGMGPVAGGADIPGSSYYALEKIQNAISSLTDDLMATPDSSINAGCARALLELSRLQQRLGGALVKASVLECVYASTLACIAAGPRIAQWAEA